MLERRTLAGGVRAIVDAELEAEGFVVAFTERHGGVSRPPFDSLNLGFGHDDAARVTRNRALLERALGVPRLRTVRQVHGASVSIAGPSPPAVADAADALVTCDAAVPLAILTADCVPVALVDEADRRVAAVHVGWRGLAAGVLATAVGAFGPGAAPAAAVGPAVGADHYEVGPEVIAAIAPVAEPVVTRADGALRLDLAATVERALAELGVGRVATARVCTACEPDRFFSYRRDGSTGRQALVVMRR